MSNAKKLMQGASGVSTGDAPKTVAVSMGSDGATAIDISDATSMSQLDDHNINCNYSVGRALDASRNIAFVTGFLDKNLVAIDVSNTSSLATLDNLTDTTNFGNAREVAVDPNIEIAFVGGSGNNKVTAVDYSTASSMSVSVVNSIGTTASGLAIDTANSRLYVGGNTLKSFTYNSSGTLTEQDSLGSVPIDKTAIDLTNNQLYGSSSNAKIYSIDISDPTNLVEDDEFTVTGDPDIEAIDHDENQNVLLAVDTDTGKVFSINTSNPASLSLSDTLSNSTLTSSAFATDIRMDKFREIAFITRRSGGFLMSIDYSNPSSLSILQTFSDGDIDGGALVLLD